MTRLLTAAMLATIGFMPLAASAQNICDEGRAGSRRCVNPSLAGPMRQGAVIYSQPKLSHTHYPVLPSLDWVFRYPNQLNPNPLNPSPVGKPSGG
jgi:hypothetical protein